MRQFHTYWCFVLFTALLGGCNIKQVDPEEIDLGQDYFPVSEGNFRTYQIKEITLLPLSKDTSNYFLKEVIGEQVDNFDEDAYLLYRYKKSEETDPWVLDSAWSVTRTTSQAIIQENSRRKLHMIFPLEEDANWDHNTYNSSDEDLFSVIALGDEYANPQLPQVYNDVVEIAPVTIRNAISVNDRQFVYQRDIGLVYHYEEVTEQQPQQEVFGRVYEAILIDSGNE